MGDDRCCDECGRAPLPRYERDVAFRLPDPVLAIPGRRDPPADQIWQTEFMQAGGEWFVRALMPVPLSGGYSLTFGVWIGLSPEEFTRATMVWSDPVLYPTYAADGYLANALPIWGLFRAPVRIEARREDERPVVVSSPDPTAERVLGEEWDHAFVLPELPS